MENRIVLDRTTIIARILSIYLSVTGLGFLVSNSYYSEMISQSGSDPVLINLSGMVHLFIGAAILTIHFLWKTPLQIVVTFLGIMFSIKGALLIVVPDIVLQSAGNSAGLSPLVSLAFILVGGIIGYFAYFQSQNEYNK